MSTSLPRPVYLDCDTGIDDSLALALILVSPEVDLVGVGTVSGNIDAERAAVNTLDLIALAGHADIPVAVGAHDFLTHPYDGGVPHIHGRNGVGDVELPPSGRRAATGSAADLLIRLAWEHAGELTVLSVGPLTNLALALRTEPQLPHLVKRVIIMGGAALVPGNVSPVTEANIGNDPEAAAAVMAASWPITLVPLDVTVEHQLTEADRTALLSAPHPLPRALGDMLDVYFDFHIGLYGVRSSALHDPMAAAITTGLAKPANAPWVHVEVDTTQGPGRGQTICDLRDQRLGPVDQPGAHVQVVRSLTEPLGPMLIARLCSLSAAPNQT